MTASKTKHPEKAAEMSFEEAFQKLEALVQSLERGDATLEESLRAFEEGMALAALCSRRLEDAEKRLQKLVKGEDGAFQLELMP
jgi:exodeoxyribonuclease VII small subunit